MLGFLQKKTTGGQQNAEPLETVKFKIAGMHCASCALNIDGELEDELHVSRAETSYAKSESKVTFDPKLVSTKQILAAIKKVGYQATVA